LLEYTKADLVALCVAEGHPFIEDPSNHNLGYARTRMRRLGGLLASEGFDRSAILRLGRRAARAEAALNARARAAGAALAARRGPGIFAADVSALAAEPEEILLRFLADELKLIGNGKQLRLERVEALARVFGEALRAGNSCTATLGGTVLRLQSDRTLSIISEGARRHRQANLPHAS
jgi:tRNA(Ile)-lysidine synthase